MQYHEISAKSNYNYEKPFLYLAKKLVGCAGCCCAAYDARRAAQLLRRLTCYCSSATPMLVLLIRASELDQGCCVRDPNLHFVEEVALAPPQVQIDMAQQQQNEAELNAAMAQPLPDEDEDLAE